jgi:hypothetical protein
MGAAKMWERQFKRPTILLLALLLVLLPCAEIVAKPADLALFATEQTAKQHCRATSSFG